MPLDDEDSAGPPTSPMPAIELAQETGWLVDFASKTTVPGSDAARQAALTPGCWTNVPEALLGELHRAHPSRRELPEPTVGIKTLVDDLGHPSRSFEGVPQANLAVVEGGAFGAGDRGRRSVVSLALPLTDNNKVPFPIEVLRSILGEILASHGGATLRAAYGLCLTKAGLEIDALIDVEIWTHKVALLIRQAERWRVLLSQREIVVRVFEQVTLRSVVDGEAEADHEPSHAARGAS